MVVLTMLSASQLDDIKGVVVDVVLGFASTTHYFHLAFLPGVQCGARGVNGRDICGAHFRDGGPITSGD